MGALVLIFLGWIASQYGRPLVFAALWSVFLLFMAAIGGAGLAVAVVPAAAGFVFAALYFSLLHHYSDRILLWLTILLGLPILWIALQFQLLAPAG